MGPVELTDRDQVEESDEHPNPRADDDRVHPGRRVVPVQRLVESRREKLEQRRIAQFDPNRVGFWSNAGSTETGGRCSPITVATTVATSPASGPAAPMSNSAFDPAFGLSG